MIVIVISNSTLTLDADDAIPAERSGRRKPPEHNQSAGGSLPQRYRREVGSAVNGSLLEEGISFVVSKEGGKRQPLR